MKNAIELDGVSKRFRQTLAVDNVSLSVPEGSIYGFVGPNGSGKTTTLRMLLRIFQPDEGSVVVLGEAAGKTADDRLGYLPEERGLYKRMKVRELLNYYAHLKGNFNCKAEVDYWLERLGATEWTSKKIESLSKGMAQKIQFIAAVAAKPQLVILDEPFSGLDPVNLESLRDAILSLRDSGTTVVFSTHDMDMAEQMCDRVFMIFKGKKVLDGTMQSIQADFPANTVRVALGGEDTSLPQLAGVEQTRPRGRYQELTLRDPAQAQKLLHELAGQRIIEHFEVVKPSLHDIFVSIAKPSEHEQASSISG